MIAVTCVEQAESVARQEEICLWKLVLVSNLDGEGTSFDPNNLNMTANKCLSCDGSDQQCRRFVS